MESTGNVESPAPHELHEYYSNIIASLKRSHEDKENQLTYKLQKLENLGADDEYLVSEREQHIFVCEANAHRFSWLFTFCHQPNNILLVLKS